MTQTLQLTLASGSARWRRLALVGAACGLALHFQAAAAGPAQAPSGTALFKKAQALEAAGQYQAAETAYNQAVAAYRRANDLDGQQLALTHLAAVDEKIADQLLANVQLAPPAPVAGGPVIPAARPVAARPAAPVAARPAAPTPAAARPAAPVLAPPGPAPLAGSTAGGRPVGLFFFVSVFNEQRTYYFTPAGQIYVNPADYSAAGLAAVAPNWRGTVAINGKAMTVKWANGETNTYNYHFDPTGFGWNGSFICVAPIANARQLLGTFEGRNAAATVDANSAVLFRTLNFKADGTFTRDNFAAAHVQANSGFATDASSAAQQAGRWNLNGWFLTLSDARGTVRGVAFATGMDDKTGRIEYFRFNGTSYRNSAQP